MTHHSSPRSLNSVRLILVALIGLGMCHRLPGDELQRLDDATSKKHSSTANTASFRITDTRLESAYPRAPGALLADLADAEIPTPQGEDKSEILRALPPLNVDLESISSPVSPSDLGVSCTACETCGSLDTRDSGNTCGSCAGNSQACCHGAVPEGWFQNTLIFVAGDGWKNILDDDKNNNFGFRTGFNMGLDLPGQRGVRGQIGLSYGAYDFHGREQPLQNLQNRYPNLRLSRDDPVEQQVFGTAGIYKRSVVASGDPLAWGVVYDVMMSRSAGDAADRLKLAQLRGYFGYAINERNEIGTWMAFRLMKDRPVRQDLQLDQSGMLVITTETLLVNVTDQMNLFWHRTWGLGGDTTAYVGWADDPGNVVLGLDGRVPLNRHAALFGNVHYIIPSTTGGDNHPTIGTDDIFTQEAWNVSFGIMLYRGGKSVSPNVSGVPGLPLLPVADNGSFSYQTDF